MKVIALLCWLIATLPGQSAAPANFEVAAIKPSAEQSFMTVRALPGGRLTATAPVRLLIQNAYSLQPFQIVGGPSWIDNDRFEIDAKAEGNPTRGQQMRMLQSLLEDRFRLQTHRETRQLPVYALTVAKGGPKLAAPKAGGCTAVDPDAAQPLPPPGTPPPCGRMVVRVSPRGVALQGGRIPIAEFVRIVSTVMGRTVVDRTGLGDAYDIKAEFTPDSLAAGLPPLPPGFIRETRDDAPPSILTAFQEQLGLKLESTKGPVDVLVVDRVERPTAN